MTLTPEQLEAIATKLLGWKRCGNTEYYQPLNSGAVVRRDPPDTNCRHDALLVLEAMLRENDVRLEGLCDDAYKCTAIPNHRGHEIVEVATPPAAAIFACAAKLVERM